jgi:arylsulfatase A-like enzyme
MPSPLTPAAAPNILWICTDSQRFDTLGCYGNPFVRTPNADRLAARGVLFENCFAQNPLCTPSRGSFLTGRYPITTKLRQNGQSIPPGERLVTRLLADHDYVCGLSGKLHLAACNRRFLLGEEWWQLPRELELIQGTEPRIDDGYAEFYWDHAPSPMFRSSAYTQWIEAHGALELYRKEKPARADCPHILEGMPAELHQTTFCAEMAENFIERHAGYPHPWLFSVNIFDPHFHCDPPEEYLQPYLERLDEIPLPNYVPGELDNKPPWQMERHAPKTQTFGGGIAGYGESDTGDPHQHRLLRAAYWAQCDLIDAQLGRLLGALERTGQRENTLVIFTSDHGEMLGDHGLYIKGPFLYDPAIQVPLIVSWPGHVLEGVRTKALVELSDLAPTLLEAAGLPRHPGMQTRSLWPLLTGAAPLDRFRDDVYCEYLNSNPDHPKTYLTMVRTATHKIVAAHGAGTGELYDLAADPTETRNLWDDPAAASVKTEMLVRLCDRLAMTADPLPVRTGIY